MPCKLGIATLAIGLTLLLAGCSSEPSDSGTEGGDDAATVVMNNMAFTPKEIRIQVGDAVHWVNKDSVGHTVSTEAPAQWGTSGSGDDSNQWMQKGETWSHTFMQPGTYRYYCKPHATGPMGNHQGMIGSVIVEA